MSFIFFCPNLTSESVQLPVCSMIFADDSSPIDRVQSAIAALGQALQRLYEHDDVSAQIDVVSVRQVLEELQLDFDLHFQAAERLERLFQSC